MIKHFAFAALSLALVPATASAETSAPKTIEYQGARYTYTVTEKADGVRVLRGMEEKSFSPFLLTVGKKRVTGTVNGSPVSFSLRSVKPLQGTVEVAAR
jgi:hypothetical protein